jgi:hypothetical protein
VDRSSLDLCEEFPVVGNRSEIKGTMELECPRSNAVFIQGGQFDRLTPGKTISIFGCCPNIQGPGLMGERRVNLQVTVVEISERIEVGTGFPVFTVYGTLMTRRGSGGILIILTTRQHHCRPQREQ